jgi:glucose-6-phosphate isomerase
LSERLGTQAAAQHFTAVTEPGDNPLRNFANRHGIPIIDHDPNLGGRFSVLSLVGLLPARLAGIDVVAVRAGAASVLEALRADPAPATFAPAVGAAVSVALQRERQADTTVLMPYADRLAPFGLWFRQLWAESLGKNGKGTTPVRALGTVDQHSQLQLYLDGPRDKMFTLLAAADPARGPRVPAELASDPRLDYLAGRHMGDLLAAEQRATYDTLAAAGRPVRVLSLERIDERGVGALLMHFMLETLIAADLLGVDPFGQPAVEDGKKRARAYLAAKPGRGAARS